MNVKMVVTHVMRMQTVPTLWAATIAPVHLDSQEMDWNVLVCQFHILYMNIVNSCCDPQ